ncbi:MAG: hypothetical protein P1U85_15935 [Verrucomicrobiales bacterium]|nr:hypothetical protein [Verrucomicrobiales bacterium]
MKHLRQILAVSGFALSAALLSFPDSLLASDASSRIRFTTLSEATSPGLRSDFVRDIVQDVSGYVWIATDQGLDPL